MKKLGVCHSRRTGATRGIAIAEFSTVEHAQHTVTTAAAAAAAKGSHTKLLIDGEAPHLSYVAVKAPGSKPHNQTAAGVETAGELMLWLLMFFIP